jgi:hypothetical protein
MGMRVSISCARTGTAHYVTLSVTRGEAGLGADRFLPSRRH